jgi:hypothetical protein
VIMSAFPGGKPPNAKDRRSPCAGAGGPFFESAVAASLRRY